VLLGADPLLPSMTWTDLDWDLTFVSGTKQSVVNMGTTTGCRGNMTMMHDGFFAVGRDTIIAATDLGINPAAVFLALARGTGRNNIGTGWSAEAPARDLPSAGLRRRRRLLV
jgi:hypothetical protein